MSTVPLRIGVVGLGRAFTLMLPTFLQDPRVRLVAACDPLPEARRQFEADFGAPALDSVEALCARPEVQVVYIASPHQFHVAHVALATAAGKHVLVEKPMALTVDDCTRMIDAAKAAGVQLIVGHSHSFNAPIRQARAMIDSGAWGRVRMITALNFTDFLYRPRRPEELDTHQGGGVIHSQAAHQIDIVRLLGGGRVRSIQAHTGRWDPQRPTEGAYSALLGFDGGAFASVTYSGYGHFDSDVWMDGVGELGGAKPPDAHGAARRRLTGVANEAEEAQLKADRNYGGRLYQREVTQPQAYQHFGPLIVSCEGADLQPTPQGVRVLAHDKAWLEALPPVGVPRQEVVDELWSVVVQGQAPLHSGEWARATTEVCLGLLQAAASGLTVRPVLQVGHNRGHER